MSEECKVFVENRLQNISLSVQCESNVNVVNRTDFSREERGETFELSDIAFVEVEQKLLDPFM